MVAGLTHRVDCVLRGGFPALSASRAGPSELAYVPADATVVAYANVHDVMDVRAPAAAQGEAGRGPGRGGAEGIPGTDRHRHRTRHRLRGRRDDAGGRSRHERPRGGARPVQHDPARNACARARRHRGAVQGQASGDRDRSATRGVRRCGRDRTPVANSTITLAFLEPDLVAIGSDVADQELHRRPVDGAQHHQQRRDDGARRPTSTAATTAWAVGRFDALAAHANLPPDVQSRIPAVKTFAVMAHIDGGLTGTFRAETRDDQSAENLRQVVNGFLALGRMQAQNNPQIAAMLQSLQLSGTGKTVSLSFAVPAEVFDLHSEARRSRTALSSPDGAHLSGPARAGPTRVTADSFSAFGPLPFGIRSLYAARVHARDRPRLFLRHPDGGLRSPAPRRHRRQAALRRPRSDSRRALRSRHLSRRRAGARRTCLGRGLRDDAISTRVLAALDEIEGYRPEHPDRSLYTRAVAECCCRTARSPRRGSTSTTRRSGRRSASRPAITWNTSRYDDDDSEDRSVDCRAARRGPVRACARAIAGQRRGRDTPAAMASIRGSSGSSRPMSQERLQQLLEKLVSFGTRNTLSDATSNRGHRRGAPVDLRRVEAHEPAAAGQLRHVSDSGARPHHARRRAPQRDGDPSRQDAAAHLRQRPLRLAQPRRARAARRATSARALRAPTRPGAAAAGARRARGTARAARLQHRRAGRERRWERHGAVDGAGARVRGERHRVRRDARVHDRGGGGAGAHRLAARTRRRRRRSTSRSKPGSTTTSSATRTAATEWSTARRSASIRKGRTIRRRARWPCSRGALAAEYVPSHRVRLMARPDRFRPRRRSQRATTPRGSPRSASASRARIIAKQHGPNDTIDGVDFQYLGAERARERRRDGHAGARAAAAPGDE